MDHGTQAARIWLCMLICIFTGGMDSNLVPGTAGITDENVTQSAPMVRALVVERLEKIWRACEPHILPPPPAPGEERLPSRPDPRFVEAGIKVNDRLIALYGLLKPQTAAGDEDQVTTQAQVDAAIAKAAEIEKKLSPEG